MDPVTTVVGVFALVVVAGLWLHSQGQQRQAAGQHQVAGQQAAAGDNRYFAYALREGGSFEYGPGEGPPTMRYTLNRTGGAPAGAASTAGVATPVAIPPAPNVRRGPGGEVIVDAPMGLANDATIFVSVGRGRWDDRGNLSPGDRAVDVLTAPLPAAGTPVEIGLSYTGAARDLGPTRTIRI